MSEPTNVTSGLGYFSGVITVSATPINIFGAIAADVSGRHGITDTSGALNVNISGGSISTNVSGQPVGLTSGAYIFGYQYGLVSGAGIVNIQSGASVLHNININAWVSGGQLAIMDSLSGNAGASVGVIDFTEVGSLAANAFAPQTMAYDIYMKSGIVIVTSGAALNATVSFKNPV